MLMSPSLLGDEQRFLPVTLQRVLMTSVQNNLAVQNARLSPSISNARLIAANAAFDWTLFSNNQFQVTDEPQVTTSGSFPVTNNQTAQTIFGLRRRLTSGGTFAIQQELTYQFSRFRQVSAIDPFSPNPSDRAQLTLQVEQPLLRGFGSDVSLAEVRLAENAERDQVQVLHATLLQNLSDTEAAYWNVLRAQRELLIAQRSLARGLELQEVFSAKTFDVRQAQRADAMSTVESRRADVIRSENALRDASDRLKTLVNDSEVPIGSELVLLPLDAPVEEGLSFNLVDAINTAMNNRPEIKRALLAIDDASIRQFVADNGRLPQLDLRAQTRLTGQGGKLPAAVAQQYGNDASFMSWLFGLNFEQPIGNVAAEAQFRQRRLEKMQSVLTYRQVVQRVIADLKEQLRNVESTYRLIEQTRAARLAAAENLRALGIEEKTTGSLTPEFLDLKFRRQAALAQAEQAEVGALVGYNIALARFFSAQGTALERNRIKFEVPDVK
jgi:outer membrane protein TolC